MTQKCKTIFKMVGKTQIANDIISKFSTETNNYHELF